MPARADNPRRGQSMMKKPGLGVRFLATVSMLGVNMVAGGAASGHPLDPLSSSEMTRAVSILRAGGELSNGKIATVTLEEPAKNSVLAWKEGDKLPRQALVRILQNARTFQGIVDLDTGKIVSWKQFDKQPSFMLGEIFGAIDIVEMDAGWREAMAKRGYTKFDTIICNPLAVGYVADPAERKLRLMNVPCFDGEGAKNNTFARPIEGLLAVVDLNAKRVVRLIDLGVVPVPPEMPQHDYASQNAYRKPMHPIILAAPQGDNITMTGNIVQWDNWSFHVRMDRRVGPVVSLLRWDDHGAQRAIAYQISPSEMFVPYMDSSPTWSFKSYLDAGEYGLGLLATPLAPGSDCPATARFVDATFTDDDGKPLAIKRALCLFERNTGNPVWRHVDGFTSSAESRPDVELVVRSIATIGNYDYILDFVFNQAGEIEVKVGATGIDAVKAVKAQSLSDLTAADDTRAGTLIAPGLVGVSHDHYVNFRMDLDVDGEANAAAVVRTMPERISGNPGRSMLWRAVVDPVRDAGPVDLSNTGTLTISAPTKNALGYSPSYELLGGHSTTSVLSPDDQVQARANFSTESTWLTTFDPTQLHAAGEWPNQSGPNEGLPAFTKGQPPLGQDIVVWQTIGFRHVTRSEDWPIMPTLWHSFKLRPHNFFTRNPAMDVSPEFQK
jgi:primary-amine oxidase